uniref:NADH-ubiquinone oxidoreductase chain 1 n=1 Tax=Cymothoa indica TaxID=439382 RepID=A0A344AYW8_9CRUS|nr:NADH dehydrogenase subunit 1 [Cymothoa indica]
MNLVGALMVFMKIMVLLVSVLLGVAFVTYCERKFLGYVQLRKGPNKVGYKGIFQPFSDAIKLFTNEVVLLNKSNYWLFLLSPLMMLSLMLMIWFSLPSSLGLGEMSLGMVFVFCCLGMGVYPALMSGWFSNSKYSMLGSLRVVAQTISYEISMVLIMFSFVIVVGSYVMDDYFSFSCWGIFVAPLLGAIWLISLMAELNRTPFDLTEGESELVSGFHTEYGSGLFVMFFLAEYGMILFLGSLFSLVMLGGGVGMGVLSIKAVLVVMVLIWVRSVLPRMRYDKLMMLTWKVFLPCSLFYFMFFIGLHSLTL